MNCKGCGWFSNVLYGGFCLEPEIAGIRGEDERKKGCGRFVPWDGSMELPRTSKNDKTKNEKIEFKVKGSNGNQYKIYVYKNDVLCTCPDYMYHRRKRKEICKHIKANMKRVNKYREALWQT